MSNVMFLTGLRLCYGRATIVSNMPQREQDDFQYRSPMTAVNAPAPVSSTNEANYDTLQIVRDQLRDAVNNLYKDFNAFNVSPEKTEEEAAKIMLRQVTAKQMAFDILSPVLEAVDNAVKLVDDKYKQR
jgi:hypothetical protein